MPLEYVAGGRVSQKTDSYAFGVVLCELLTGRPPLAKRLSITTSQGHSTTSTDTGEDQELLAQEMARVLAETCIESLLPRVLDLKAQGGWPVQRAITLGRLARQLLALRWRERVSVSDVRGEIEALAADRIDAPDIGTVRASFEIGQDGRALGGSRLV